jgi:Resolvase, N terminal domain
MMAAQILSLGQPPDNCITKLKRKVKSRSPHQSRTSSKRNSATKLGAINDEYARVSTDGQTLQAQTEALHAAGCAKIYSEKISGAYSERPQLAKALSTLTADDCLVVCKLDRLARSTRDLLNTLDTIAKAGATFKSLGDAWCDTTTPTGKLMPTVWAGSQSTSGI